MSKQIKNFINILKANLLFIIIYFFSLDKFYFTQKIIKVYFKLNFLFKKRLSNCYNKINLQYK